jgi:hypothetical protein
MVDCIPYSATLSESACAANQRVAEDTLREIGEGESIFTFPDSHINRMLVCGRCERSSIDPEEVKAAFRTGMDRLLDKLDRYAEWGYDPERSRVLTYLRNKQWRLDNRESVLAAAQARRDERRLNQLRRDYGKDARKA